MDNKTLFSVTEVDNTIKVQVEGSMKDLINALANAIDDNEDVERLIMLAFISVQIKREKNGDDKDEDSSLVELLSKMKPTAQA